MVEWKKLGDIGKCMAGATPSTKERSYWENGTISWMSSGEVHQDIVTYTASSITQAGYDNASTKLLPIGTIVIALAGQGKTRGSVAITAIELCTNQSLCGIVIDNDNIVNKYVFYYLKTRYDDLRRISSGEGTRGGLNLKMIGSYPIPIPSLSEQNRIVGILDTFTSSIENLKQQISERRKQYEHYRDQLLDLALVKWPKVTLKDVAIIKNGKDYKNLSNGNVPVYGTGGIMTYVDQHASTKPSVLLPRKGSVENIFYVDKPFWTVDTLYWTDINDNLIIPKYLYLSLRRYNLKEYAYGGARPSLSQPILYKLELSLPSLDEQSRIVSILDTFEASISNLEAQLKEREKQYEYYRNKLLTFE